MTLFALGFLDPLRLWLLLGILALVVVYVVVQQRRRRYAVRFTNLDLLASVAPRRPGWRRHATAAVYLVALAAMVVAFARPTWETQVPRERATVMLAIDTSLSMDATDVDPSRLQAAQRAAVSFLDQVPATVNVGLVTFNAAASLRVPPTTDRDAVRTAIANVQLGERTAIGEAIFTSLDALTTVPPAEDGSPVPAAVVLMSDGTNTNGRSDAQASAAAAEAGVPVSTIAFGTDEGFITLPDQAAIIPVPVDRPALEAIADATDGRFYEATTESELREVYATIGSSVGFETVDTEVTSWFVGGALVFLFVAGGLSLAWFSRLP
ncbi:MAG: VWA domain-containing protein [Acidimicrobiales bacterium]|nr:VWA domain-containing protein [Acidimicrobiales bacterium]